MDREHEQEMIDGYATEVREKIQERERERKEEEEMRSGGETTEPASIGDNDDDDDNDTSKKTLKIEVHATATHTRQSEGMEAEHEQLLEPVVAHAQSHDISHNMAVSVSDSLARLHLILKSSVATGRDPSFGRKKS